MGCGSSKLDELPAVALCRQRCAFLDQAIRQRYALAQAHLAYLHSLKSVGFSLHRFFHHEFLQSLAPAADSSSSFSSSPSPVLSLPPQRKGDPDRKPSSSSSHPPAAAVQHSHSHSNSGSHLNFHSDSDDLHSDSESLHHQSEELGEDGDSSPLHNPYAHLSYLDHDDPLVGSSYPRGGGFMNINYMKNQPTPSVVYQYRPETVHMGESSSYFPHPNPNPYNYSNYGGFFGSPPGRQPYNSSLPPAAGPSSSSNPNPPPPPPPPSPPRSSAWDFLNPFESFDKYYPPYTPSRDSREVREEEGIPDLEDEDFQQEVVKEVHGDQKFVDGGAGGADNSYSKAEVEDEGGELDGPELIYRARPSASMDHDPMEYEVHVVDRKVVNDEEGSGDRANVAASKARAGFSGDSEVVKEIQVQFERASDAGNELAKVLEVGKLPYKRRHAAYQVSSKMLHAITPSLSVVSSHPSTSKMAEPRADPTYLDIDNVDLSSKNLSSTLQKLYFWEKKLYEEIKVEEQMRTLHEQKCRKLKRLDDRGAEAHKVDATRTLVRSLSTKIRIAIQVVDTISVKINNLRDETLWPQLNELIQGFSKMWKSMLECHRSQRRAIGKARRLDAIASHKSLSDAHLEATLQLEHELLNWILTFSCWFGAQTGYVGALNSWLLKCLLYEPEETPEETSDGPAPFSPGRIGAPPVFVICNQWSQALERTSEKQVIDSMRDFAANVLQLWEQDKLEMRRRMMANKDVERKVKNFEKEDKRIQKELQALDKRMILVAGDGNGLSLTGQVINQGNTGKNSSLQVGLQHVFETMENFAANNLRVYEELLQRIEEDGLNKKREKVS